MPRGFFNWRFTDVKRFLLDKGFLHINTEGSHYYFAGRYSGEPRLVHVPFHTSKAIKPRTLKSIIKQSGIPKEEWFKG